MPDEVFSQIKPYLGSYCGIPKTQNITLNKNNLSYCKQYIKSNSAGYYAAIEFLDIDIDPIQEIAEYLDKMNADLWIRHVVVPGITDDPIYLHKLGLFIGGLNNLKALDVLPYHTMGKSKYEKLGMEYPLKDVPNMDKANIPALKQLILDGIKERRAMDK